MKMFTKFLLFAIVANVMLGSTAFGQILQRGTATNATTTNTTLTITKPTGVVAGDVMLVNIAQGGNNSVAPTSAGWTIVDGRSLAGTTQRYGSVFYRVADGTEGASFTFTLGAGTDAASGSIVAFSGVNGTGGVTATGAAGGPFDVDPGIILVPGSGSTTVNATTTTTVSANAAVIMLGEAAGANPTWSAWSTTSPGALTELYDNPNGSNTQTSVGAAWAIKPTAGATGGGTATLSISERNGGLLVVLKPGTSTPTATLSPVATQYILTGGNVVFTATASNFTGSGNYTYTWATPGATITGTSPNTIAASSDTKTLTYAAAGTYTVIVTIARSGAATLLTDTTTVVVADIPTVPNLWASSGSGTIVSSFNVINGIYIAGPTTLFTPTFPGTTTGGTTTAAIGRNDLPSQPLGYYYWLPNTSGNGGVVELFAATSTGGTPTRIGSIDVNGGSNNSLGFVRLGIGPTGIGWLLAGDGTTLYLAKFTTNGVQPVTIITVPVSLGTGSAATFQNGDIAVNGNNKLFALANDGNGVTQLFTGNLNNPSVVIDAQLNLLDQNNVPFTGSVNGIAFDANGSAYFTTATGLYFADKATVNGPAGTIQCKLVVNQTGLQDLASNFFPTGSILPVQLLNFLGNYNSQKTTLSWETENMVNFSHFEIQRSTTGNDYSSIANMNSKGDGMTRTRYQYTDNLAGFNGKVFYYRLKMVDIDGQFKYSNIIVIKKDQKTDNSLVIYPNPAVKNVKSTASFYTATNSTVIFKIVDMTGKVVLTQQNNVQQGNNNVTINNLERLQPGMYILQANDNQTTRTTKLFVANQ